MVAAPGPDSDLAAAEATDWLILMREEPNDPDLRRRFEAWRVASPTHAAAWAEVTLAYDLVGDAVGTGRKDVASVGTAPRSQSRSRHRSPVIRRAAVAAVFAVAACLAIAFLPNVMLRLDADYATGAGEQREVRLADGSTAFLGPASAIDITYTGEVRRIRLLAGHAFFEVTPDKGRPFEVSAHGVRTTVLGTGFDVRLAAEGTVVAVRHGLVQVAYSEASPPVLERLGAGNWLQVNWDGRTIAGTELPDHVDAWQHWQLVADDRPAMDVLDELRPYYQGAILVTDGALDRLRVTGLYDLRDPVGAVQALAAADPGVSIYRISPWLVVVSGF